MIRSDRKTMKTKSIDYSSNSFSATPLRPRGDNECSCHVQEAHNIDLAIDLFSRHPVHTHRLTPEKKEPGLIGPCTGEHTRDHIPRQWIEQLATQVSAASNLSLRHVPEVCVPSDLSRGFAFLLSSHAATATWSTRRSREQHEWLGSKLTARVSDTAGTYFFASHQISLSRKTAQQMNAPHQRPELRRVLLHELTHAAQAEHYPHLLHALRKNEEAVLSLYSGDINSPSQAFSAILSIARSTWSRYIAHFDIAERVLLEGHASWVERILCLSPQEYKSLIDMPFEGVYRRSVSSQPTGWLGLLVAPAMPFFTNLFWPNEAPYETGFRLVDKIQALQAELQSKTFVDSQGRTVQLSPTLAGDGLLHHVMSNPAFLEKLMPNLKSSWMLSSRVQIDIEPLRAWVLERADHVVSI